jgi:RimJ/RimL family protein N-acetyltransferase
MTAYCIPAGDNTELVGLYVGDKTGMQFQSGMFTAFAILNGLDEFIGGVVISNYRDHDCEISCAAETSMAWQQGVMRAVFRYIFWQLGCVRVTASTKKGNRKARGFLEGLGFVLEGNLRRAYDGKHDALIYGLLASECRYLDGPEEGVGVSEGGTEEADDEGENPDSEALVQLH